MNRDDIELYLACIEKSKDEYLNKDEQQLFIKLSSWVSSCARILMEKKVHQLRVQSYAMKAYWIDSEENMLYIEWEEEKWSPRKGLSTKMHKSQFLLREVIKVV